MVGSARNKVLYLNNSMAMGGIETMILDFIRLAPKGGYEAGICVFEAGGVLEGKALELEGKLYHLPKREGFDPSAVFRLHKLCRETGINVLHSHNFASWLYGGIARRFIPGIRHIHTEHSGVEPSPRRFFLERRLTQMTDVVVAVSKGVKRYMVDRVGIPANKVRIVYNGVDLNRFTYNEGTRSKIRSELSISTDDVVAGVVARLVPVKGHGFLLEAMRILSEKAPPLRLMIVGDGDLRKELEQKTAVMGLSNRVSFLGERQDIPQIMSAMDMYVLPSESEGMNLTLLEAMSIGLPVVARDVGGNSEVVCHGETGLLVSSRDVKQFAEGLMRMAEGREERKQMGLAGQQRVRSQFDQTLTISTYLGLYSGRNGQGKLDGKAG